MEIKKRVCIVIEEIVVKIVGIIVDIIFYLADRYPKSFFKKFIL